MAIHSGAGTVVSIATTSGVSTVDLTGFQAKTYQAVGEIVNIGDFGKKFNVIKHMPIGTRYTKKLKGSYDNGSMALSMASDNADAGQIIMKTASDSDLSYAFKIVEQDGTTTYFTAQTISFVKKISGVDSIVAMDASLEIDSNLF